MRVLFLFAVLLGGCSAAPPPTPKASGSIAELPISCHGGRLLRYSRKLPDGTTRSTELHCTDDHVTAESWITGPVPEGLDMDPTLASSSTVEIDRSAFEHVWRAVISGRCDRTKPTRSSVTVTDMHAKRSVTCADDDGWSALFVPVEPYVEKPPQNDDDHVVWPFGGEYWRDELVYYRE